jgi:transposase
MELLMSRKERERLKIVEKLNQREISQAKAGELLELSERQVRRMLVRWRREGDSGLIHRSRGRPALNRIDPGLREHILALLQAEYPGFGPTLATEHLADDHGIEISRESVRRIMLEAHLYPERSRGGHRRHRARRECLGELVQLDTSVHEWFEGRGEQAVLIHAIDDATSRSVMRFFPADTTLANMELIGCWIGAYGRPLAFYVDYAGHFKQLGRRGRRLANKIQTQIERALAEMEIAMINARSPQAKGRVERSFGTLQDRLVKELRLRGIGTIQEANRFLDEQFIAFWNERFAVAPARPIDAHRSAQGLDLAAILSVQQTRRVGNDYTFQFGARRWQIEHGCDGGRLAGQRVKIEEHIDGSMHVRWQRQYLDCTAVVMPSKQILAATAGVGASLRGDSLRSSPLRSAPTPAPPRPHTPKPAPNHPWRKRTFSLCTK